MGNVSKISCLRLTQYTGFGAGKFASKIRFIIFIVCLAISLLTLVYHLGYIKVTHKATYGLNYRGNRIADASVTDIILYSTINFSSNPMNKYESYLRPVTTLFTAIDLKEVPHQTRDGLENIIRYGYGLQPYRTEKGEDAWIENGIVYRQSRTKNPNGYTPEYESFVPFDEDMFFEGRTPDPKYQKEKKIILWYIAPSMIRATEGLQPLESCPDFPCVYSTNRDAYLKNSSAVLFAANKIKQTPPRRTSPDQVFVLQNHEAPNFFRNSKFNSAPWKSVFNFTFSYRMDSDFSMPYGIVRRRPKMLENKDYRAILSNKTGMVAWVASHCKTVSKRFNYVRALQKYIPVDIMGKCGPATAESCPRTQREFCTDKLAARYKFYLGFENAIAQDYVTEKLFDYMIRDVVVVARGNDHYFQHVPRETFINTNDFASPKELAQRLLELHEDDEAYMNILREKDKYTIIFEDHEIAKSHGLYSHNDFMFHAVPMCLLCQRLWNLDRHRQSINDVHTWLMKGKCKIPK